MQELAREHLGGIRPGGGVSFYGRIVGVWQFDEFFERALRANTVYVLKNWMGFQAGMNPRIKDSLKHLFVRNRTIQICYAFPTTSEAATTFRNFRSEILDEFPSNVKWIELPGTATAIRMLGGLFASPFIIEYPDEKIDVLLEVPVKALATSDANDLSGFTTMFIEMPDIYKHRFWAEWKPVLWREFTKIEIKVVSDFTNSIDQMRSAAYTLTSSTTDEFDGDSFFVVAQCDGLVVGSIRLTDSSKASPLKKWSGGKCPLPTGDGVVELTRGTVLPGKRGLQIYKWMMLRALREASKRGYATAVAAIEVNFRQQGFLFSLGFKPHGEPLHYDDLPRIGTEAQPISCDLKESNEQWETVEREVKARTYVNIENI